MAQRDRDRNSGRAAKQDRGRDCLPWVWEARMLSYSRSFSSSYPPACATTPTLTLVSSSQGYDLAMPASLA